MDEEELTPEEQTEEQNLTPFRYSITSYGADYPVDGLVKRITEGGIFIPSFQRGYVWTLPQASRFVESLLLGLPVPGIFLSKATAAILRAISSSPTDLQPVLDTILNPS